MTSDLTTGDRPVDAGPSRNLVWARIALGIVIAIAVILIGREALFGGWTEASLSRCPALETGFRLTIDSDDAPWGTWWASVEVPDELRADLADGHATVRGTLDGGSFYGPHGMVVDNLSGAEISCAL